jgi:hypothetical protein
LCTDLKEEGGPVADGAREYLKQGAVPTPIGHDPKFLGSLVLLLFSGRSVSNVIPQLSTKHKQVFKWRFLPMDGVHFCLLMWYP